MKRLLFATALLLLGIARTGHAQTVVIANQDVPVDRVSSETLEAIYLLKQSKWENGSRIARFDLDTDGGPKNRFYSFFGQQASEVKKVWLRKKLSGEAQPPEQVSAGQVIDKVSSTSGAIGYVPASKVTEDVKVIATIE